MGEVEQVDEIGLLGIADVIVHQVLRQGHFPKPEPTLVPSLIMSGSLMWRTPNQYPGHGGQAGLLLHHLLISQEPLGLGRYWTRALTPCWHSSPCPPTLHTPTASSHPCPQPEVLLQEPLQPHHEVPLLPALLDRCRLRRHSDSTEYVYCVPIIVVVSMSLPR